MHFVAVFLDELYDVARAHVYSRGVVAWVDSHSFVLEVLVEEEYNRLILVIQEAKRCYGASIESELVHQIVFRREGQRACTLLILELFEVHLLVLKTSDQIIFLFLVIANEEVLGDLLRMWKIAFEHLINCEHSLVFYNLILNLIVVQQFYNVLFS